MEQIAAAKTFGGISTTGANAISGAKTGLAKIPYLNFRQLTARLFFCFFQILLKSYAVGPAPRTAIDSGELGNWDVNFFEAEVKSSVVYWHPITGTQMYELDPIEEDKTPTVWTMSVSANQESFNFCLVRFKCN